MNKKLTSTQSETDWERLKNMKDEEIDYSDIPKLAPDMFKNPVVRKGLKPLSQNARENLPIDRDIIEFFKSQSQNYQAAINQLLRSYMEANRTK
jgi:uncharacterized protein (DUF4415 family)